jgi:hypothetical protein
MYVCMYVLYVCMHVCVYVCVCMHVCVCVCLCVNVSTAVFRFQKGAGAPRRKKLAAAQSWTSGEAENGPCLVSY